MLEEEGKVMNTNTKTDGVIAPKTSVPHSIGDVIARLLALLLLLIMSARVEAQFAFTNIAGGIMITRHTGPSQVVTIPDMINGQPVIAIGGSAFSRFGFRWAQICWSVEVRFLAMRGGWIIRPGSIGCEGSNGFVA